MTSEEITQYLTELNDELRLVDTKGEISLYGGAVKDDVLKIVADYYPKKEVSARTRVWLDEFFDE